MPRIMVDISLHTASSGSGEQSDVYHAARWSFWYVMKNSYIVRFISTKVYQHVRLKRCHGRHKPEIRWKRLHGRWRGLSK